MDAKLKSHLDSLQAQKAEFDALNELTKALKNLPPVVDDDYPKYRDRYEGKLFSFLEAAKANGRLDHFLGNDTPARKAARAAWTEWVTEIRNSYAAQRKEFLRAVLERYGAKNISGIPEYQLTDAMACLDLLRRNKVVSISEAKALLEQRVPLPAAPDCQEQCR